MLIINKTPNFLKNLTCGCGKPAEIGWHLPLPTEKEIRKLSKSEQEYAVKSKEPQPYGWSCMAHVPKGL